MMDMMNYDHGGWWMGGMWFAPLLFWILVIAAAIFIVRSLRERGQGQGQGQQESSLDILKKRYARGEIDRDTFEQMKKDIKEAGP